MNILTKEETTGGGSFLYLSQCVMSAPRYKSCLPVSGIDTSESVRGPFSLLTHYQTTNFRLFQTERVCRRLFQIRQKWQIVIPNG